MKQSSIEWIYNNLKSHFEHDGDLLEAVKMSFEQAKAMHKEEIGAAYNAGALEDSMEAFLHGKHSEAEQYYKETFNAKEK